MYPVLLTVLGRPLTSWAVFVWVGICFGFYSLKEDLKSKNISSRQIALFFTGCVLSWFIGAHWVHILTVGNSGGDSMSTSGFVLYGGLFSVVLFGFLGWLGLNWNTRVSVFELWDFGSLALAWAFFWGRIGCALYGCCYGTPVGDGFWSFLPGVKLNAGRWDSASGHFPEMLRGIRLHPTLLYEAFSILGIIVFLKYLRTIQDRFPVLIKPGAAGVYCWMIYSGIRFFLEMIRMDLRGAFYLGLSPSQWIALETELLGVIVLLVSWFPTVRKFNIRLKIIKLKVATKIPSITSTK